MSSQYLGSCLCGACQYEICSKGDNEQFFCHCSRCKKETGTVSGANVFFDDATLNWLKGESSVKHFKLQGTRKERSFCVHCGSAMPWVPADNHVVLPAGSLDKADELNPTAHLFYASRTEWEKKMDDIPSFDSLPVS